MCNVFIHWISEGRFYCFQSREKWFLHTDLGQRKSCDYTSCILNEFGVKSDKFFQWQFAQTGLYTFLLYLFNSLMEMPFKLFQPYVQRFIYIRMPFLHLFFFPTYPDIVKVMVLAGWRRIMISFNVLLVSKLPLRSLWFQFLYFHCKTTESFLHYYFLIFV